MHKIANTTELRNEINRLASTCTPGASREVLATQLRALADRVAMNVTAAWKETDGKWVSEVVNDDGKWVWTIEEFKGPGVTLHRVFLKTPDKGTLKWKKQVKTLAEAKKFADGWSKGIKNNASLVMTDFTK